MRALIRNAPAPDGTYTPIQRSTRLAYDGPCLTEIDGPREDVADIIRLSYESGKYTNDRRLQVITLPDEGMNGVRHGSDTIM